MICFFRSSYRHAIQTDVSELKIISLYLVMVSLIASSIYSFVFIRFRRRTFNFFSSYNPPIRLQKSFKPSCFYTSKKPIIIIIIIIIITQHTALLVFCINVFSVFNIYLRMITFTLFVYRINLLYSRCIAMYVIMNIFTMKTCPYSFFPRFQLTINTSTLFFYRFCRPFFK